MSDETKKTVAQQVPEKVRAWGYSIGAVFGATYVAWELAYGAPKWLTVLFAGFSATGFYVAKGNTHS